MFKKIKFLLPQHQYQKWGFIGWLKQNLFSSWFNTLLTLISIYFIFIILRDFIPWAWGGHWNTKSLRECLDLNPDVACFSVLTARWKQLLFGLYPAEEYWRPTVTFYFFDFINDSNFVSKYFKFFWFSVIYPGLAIWLLWGGSIWGVGIVYIGLSLGIFTFILLLKLVSKKHCSCWDWCANFFNCIFYVFFKLLS